MVFAVGVAALTTLYVSSPLASAVVARFAFDSPDAVNDMHSLVFMGTNVLALLVGWGLGWLAGGLLLPGERRSLDAAAGKAPGETDA